MNRISSCWTIIGRKVLTNKRSRSDPCTCFIWQIRKVVLAHRNSRCPDPSLAVDGNLFARRMSSDFRAEAAQGSEWMAASGKEEAKKNDKAQEKKWRHPQ